MSVSLTRKKNKHSSFDNSSKTFDFTNWYWGHALHGMELRYEISKPTLIEKLFGKRPVKYEYLTCMGHSTPLPEKGDVLLVNLKGGKIGRYFIEEINYMYNPSDMFEIGKAYFDGYHPRNPV
jgi:hypothetical protein